MTDPARLAERRSGVKKPLTSKRRYRVVENDEYAAFLRRVVRAYSRRVAAGDIEAITTMAALADHLEDATRQAIAVARLGAAPARRLAAPPPVLADAAPAEVPGRGQPLEQPGPAGLQLGQQLHVHHPRIVWSDCLIHNQTTE
jgi:hypothetical protein